MGSSQISVYFGCEDIATVLLPSMRVISSLGGGALDSGSYIDYGVVSFRPNSSLSISVTFQVLNAGSGPLSFSTTPYLTGDSSSFLISSSTLFPPVLLPGQAGYFTVLFAPTADISASAELNILSNDPATTGFVIHLRGKSGNVHCSVPIVSKSSVTMTGDSIALTGCFNTSLPPYCLFSTGQTFSSTVLSNSSVVCNVPPLYSQATLQLSLVFPLTSRVVFVAYISVIPVMLTLSTAYGGILGGEAVFVTGPVFHQEMPITSRIGPVSGACQFINSSAILCNIPPLVDIYNLNFQISVDRGVTFPFEAAKYFVRTLDFVAPTAQRLDRSPFGTAVTTSNLTVPTGGVYVSAQVSVPTSGPVTIIYTIPTKTMSQAASCSRLDFLCTSRQMGV